jgi:hypothetical protein
VVKRDRKNNTITIATDEGLIVVLPSSFLKRIKNKKVFLSGEYACFRENGKVIKIHEAVKRRVGRKDELVIDHIDRDKLNNSFQNLRIVTVAENNANRSKQSNNTSGFAGVSFIGRSYKVKKKVNGTQIYVGGYTDGGKFETAKEAALVSDMYTIFFYNYKYLSLGLEDELSKEDYYKKFMDDDYIRNIGLNPEKRPENHTFFRDIVVPLKKISKELEIFECVENTIKFLARIFCRFFIPPVQEPEQGPGPVGTREDEEKRMIRMIKRE